MQRRTRTACFTLTFATLTLLSPGQDAAPQSVVSTEQATEQHSDTPELTLEQAIELALANNSGLKTASLQTQGAKEELAASQTQRFAKAQILGLGAQLVTKPSVTFPAGAFGTYTAAGPIPAVNQKVEIARKPAGTASVAV